MMTKRMHTKIINDLRSNFNLQSELMRVFEENEDKFREFLAVDGDPVKTEEKLLSYRGLITGRLMRPVIKHCYMLSCFELNDENLTQFANECGCSPEVTIHHYRKNPEYRGFTLPFLKKFLRNTMKKDISEASVGKIMNLLFLLGFISRSPVELGKSNGLVFRFGDNFESLAERWLNEKYEIDTSNKRKPRMNFKKVLSAAAMIGMIVLTIGIAVNKMQSSITISDAGSELDRWNKLSSNVGFRSISPIIITDASSELKRWS